MESFRKKDTVTCIHENHNWEVLLMLRDDKPNIPFPNMWYLPWGILEKTDDSPYDGLVRETKEEFLINLGEVLEWKKYEWEEKNEVVFVKKWSLLIPEEIDLQEWQEIRFFSSADILKWGLAFHDDEIMYDYFNSKLRGVFPE